METQYTRLSMTPSGVPPVIYMSQNDIGRPIGFVCDADLSNYSVVLEATRTDGTPITVAVTVDGNICAFETTATMTNKADVYIAQIVVTNASGKHISSIPIKCVVILAAMNENSEGIEEDAPLYQQYTGTVQSLIADIRTQLNTEAAARQAAEQTLQQNINAEAAARQAADNTLQSNINAEASTRAAADQNLQAQISQIVAPSGEAPSAAEVQNARVGADGVTYPTLGDAIRANDSQLKNALMPYNSVDIVELAHPTGRTHYGVTYAWNGTECTITGTATKTSFCNIYDQATPQWMVGGNTYHVHFSGENVSLYVYEWHNGVIDSNALVNTKTDTKFTLSDDIEAITIRIRVNNGVSVNETVHPIILTSMSNQTLEKLSVLQRVYSKRMAVFGDSIMLGRDGDGTGIVEKNIPYYLHLLTSYDVENYAVGGMGWVSTRESQAIAYDVISTTDLTNYDTVLLCFGVNDSHEVLGEWNSTDETTIMGQVKKCISYIGTENPSANIILLAPFVTKSGNFPSWSLETNRDNGWNMQMLSDRLEILANFYHITFIDQQDSPMLGYGMSSLMGSDNSHPNAEGYKKLGYWLAYRLNTENKRDIKLENTIEQLSGYNSFNIIKNYRYGNETRNGVTYTCNTDGTFTVSGTATSNSFYRIAMAQNELPNWLETGRSYYIKFSSVNVSLRVYEEINGTLSSSAIVNTKKDTVYKASENITGIQLRLFVSSGTTVNETISVSVLTGMPNKVADNPPMLTIIDDDANVKFYTKLLPLIESKGVPIACSLPAGKTYDDGITTHMSWEQIVDAYRRGAEFLNHSYSHWTYTEANTHTERELWLDYTKAKNTITSHGISGGDIFVYGGLSGTLAKAKKAATQMSKCAFHSHGDEINYRQTLDRWFIKRYGIDGEPYNYNIDSLKALIDQCALHGGWMVWMIHTSDGNWNDSNVTALSAAIDYALSKGVQIVSAECGYIHYVS